ncbi:alpha/beta hydrolase [Nocardioides sp. CER19]|uniref:alpha/beta hydrolase n=1 Tax=Nocardioides sp. CER19 TaxID=3038538 RepID=UPI00244870DE|nr:alpha/beta hydrolase [Nocardioides sp. CER19]MDH2416120.1 alpha/beta hydrolase [Nocardioides sp. CER19]
MPLDPAIAAAFAGLNLDGAPRPVLARGDAAALRALADAEMTAGFKLAVAAATEIHHATAVARELTTSDDVALSFDGAPIPVRWYVPADAVASGSAVVYVHGGGMVSGSLDIYDPILRFYVEQTGVPILGVDQRLAPEFPGLHPAQDAFAALKWLHHHADVLGVDPQRVAVMGDSSGGGLAASVAIMARDRSIPLARQILIYPMLDDRNTVAAPWAPQGITWSHDMNFTGWQALLGDKVGTAKVSELAAPARLRNFDGLAAAYIEVGELDIFRDEDAAYAAALWGAGTSCELRVRAGAPHDFDWFAPDGPIAIQAIRDRVDVLKRL